MFVFSFWYPSVVKSTIPDTEVLLRLRERQVFNDGFVILHFELQGPDRMNLLISPESGSIITDWSFEEAVPSRPNRSWNSRRVYSITYTNFKLGVPEPRDTTDFWIKVENVTDGKVLDISVSGHYIWYQEQKTTEFRQRIAEFPPWTTVQSWIMSYDHYEF